MTRRVAVVRGLAMLTTLVAVLMPRVAFGEARVQRFTLVVGANFGGVERARLQYAVADAERFARVLVELGGVPAANAIVLRQPRLNDLLDALDQLTARVADARRAATAAGGRTEVLLYYSGHADEQGLLLGDDRYSYRTLRDRLDQIPADVRMVVLDACASGAFTRIKSGKARPAFVVDAASNLRGHAFLTSSAATEAAQESDRIRASYFTHYLISGFRGAADLSGDGKVTLNEAYQFAFNETLGRTVDTRAGPQHPSYEINLSGTGDVVMTDIRQTTATLVLGEDLEGRVFVRNAHNELIVELFKSRRRRVELGVEPGTYDIRIQAHKTALVAKAGVADGARIVLDARQFGAATLEATRRRGDGDVPRLGVNGRHRLSVALGMSRNSASAGSVTSGVVGDGAFGGIEYTRYIREDVSIGVAVQGLASLVGAAVAPQGVFSGTAQVIAVPVILRWNPLKRAREGQVIKPFVAASVGPVIGSSTGSSVFTNTVFSGVQTQATAGGHIGTGVDFHLARAVAVGVHGGYNWMIDFSRPVGVRDNYGGPAIAVSLGWMFGRGHPPRP